MQVAIPGRQYKISNAELESLFGSDNIKPISNYATIVNVDDPLPQNRLGGTIKSGTILKTNKKQNLDQAYEYIYENISNLANEFVPNGKIQLGISIYGFKVSKKVILNRNLKIKKILKNTGRSVRVIENKNEYLETAKVLHNKLHLSNGLEILIIKYGENVLIAKTTGIQDIDSYSKRDQNRPMRDAKVGMLPPKLAQIIINLTNPLIGSTVLDPFCGTGVLLQEASLMGLNIYGSDIQQRMIEYTFKNLLWLSKSKDGLEYLENPEYIKSRLQVGDATTLKWKDTFKLDNYQIACETYLGKPLSSLPPSKILNEIIKECDLIHFNFLKNISRQITSGTKLCLAVPAWKKYDGFYHLQTLDQLEQLGYTRISFVHSSFNELIYHRKDQTVARELVLLEKK